MVILYSERLLIRDYIESDFDAFYALITDKDVMKWMPDHYSDDKDETKRMLFDSIVESKLVIRKKFYFAITDQYKGDYVGEVGFSVLHNSDEGAVVNLGYFIRREYWGQGVATEAVGRVIDYIFNELKVVKIEASCSSLNLGSIFVLEKNKLIKESYRIKSMLLEGELHDQIDYRMLYSEWLK